MYVTFPRAVSADREGRPGSTEGKDFAAARAKRANHVFRHADLTGMIFRYLPPGCPLEAKIVPSSSEPARWRWAVTAAFGLGGITISAWGPRLPAIKTELGVGTATIGLLLAGVTVGALLGLTASTPLRHWLGGRRAVTGAILLVAATMALISLALTLGSVPLLAVAFVVIGAGIGTLDVLINVEGAAVERTAGRTLMPSMHAAWSIGAAAGSGIGAACAALGITPAGQFAGEAVVIAAAASVTLAFPAGRETPDATDAPDQPDAPPQNRGASIRRWLRGWLDVRLLLIGVVMLGVELGEGSANSWLTLAVRNNHGQSAALAALFFTVFATSEGLSRIFAGPVVDRLGRVRTVRLTTALGVVGIAAFILADNPWIVLLGVVLWGVGVSVGFPLGTSAAAASGPNPVARISVVSSIGYFANLAGPPAVGALAQAAGLLNALWVIVVLFVAAFAVAGSLAPVLQNQKQDQKQDDPERNHGSTPPPPQLPDVVN
jgi:predicted MFS family arabinose efflux permease